MYLKKEEATARYLTDRLPLGNNGHVTHFLAYVAHPNGGSTVMEAHKITREDKEGYELEEATEEELERLNKRHSRGSGGTFTLNERIDKQPRQGSSKR